MVKLQLWSSLSLCLVLTAVCVMVDRDERDILAVSNISMSLQVRQDTSFCLEALAAKKNS